MRKYWKFFVLYALFLGYQALGYATFAYAIVDKAGFVMVAKTIEYAGAAEMLLNLHVALGTIYT